MLHSYFSTLGFNFLHVSPFRASLYPPLLPPLTSPPSLKLSVSLPELTLSLAFALTGQSPRAENPLPSLLFLSIHLCSSLSIHLCLTPGTSWSVTNI
ncbi:hypothetical protein JOB18_033349 [Solea senegalensis]|uniref:Uncharacterized protein n=1 Tax=Solea senegalensis TaxID=28829 RepID=A0AAV6QCG7_SOLSE|nr:hypothetical protein JOB18_033349 [Solea senegalensis]